jgi:hypothetical protein
MKKIFTVFFFGLIFGYTNLVFARVTCPTFQQIVNNYHDGRYEPIIKETGGDLPWTLYLTATSPQPTLSNIHFGGALASAAFPERPFGVICNYTIDGKGVSFGSTVSWDKFTTSTYIKNEGAWIRVPPTPTNPAGSIFRCMNSSFDKSGVEQCWLY